MTSIPYGSCTLGERPFQSGWRGRRDDRRGGRTSADVHLAFKQDIAFSGGFDEAAAADRRAIETIGAALEGSGRPLVIASGFAGHANGTVVAEDDEPDPTAPAGPRMLSERAALALATAEVRSASVRMAPTVHGEGDHGFAARLVEVARAKGVSG